MDFFGLPQLIGYAAYLAGTSAGLQKKDSRLFLLFSLSSLLFCFHHFLLNNLTAASSHAVIAVRMYLNRSYKGAMIAIPFALIALAFGAMTYQTPYSLLPLGAVLAATFGAAYLGGIGLRLIFISCCFLWVVHDYAMGSLGGLAQDLTTITVHTVTCFRLLAARKKESRKGPDSLTEIEAEA